MNECDTAGTCPPSSTCANLPGTFECQCDGFTIAPTEKGCYGLYVEFLSTPEKLLFDFTSQCQKIEKTVSDNIPTNAVAVLASLTTFNSQRNDHVVYSLGRDNSVTCYFHHNQVYEANTYFNDVLQTQNGDAGGASVKPAHPAFSVPCGLSMCFCSFCQSCDALTDSLLHPCTEQVRNTLEPTLEQPLFRSTAERSRALLME